MPEIRRCIDTPRNDCIKVIYCVKQAWIETIVAELEGFYYDLPFEEYQKVPALNGFFDSPHA